MVEKRIFKKSHCLYIIILLIFLITSIVPFLPLIFSGVSYNFRWPRIIPSNFSSRALKFVFVDNPYTLEAVTNTITIGAIVILLDLVMAVPAALALVRYNFIGKRAMMFIIFAPIIVPPSAAIMGIYIIFIKLGLADSRLGVILAHLLPTLPYMIIALMVSINTIDLELEEQASILGAPSYKRFFYVTLPHMLPGVFTGISLTFLISASQYFLTLLVGGGKITTLTTLMLPYINGGDRAVGAIYSIIFSLVAILNILLLDIVLNRYYKSKKFKTL